MVALVLAVMTVTAALVCLWLRPRLLGARASNAGAGALPVRLYSRPVAGAASGPHLPVGSGQGAADPAAFVSVDGLLKWEAEDLIDWLQVHAIAAVELSVTDAGRFTVRYRKVVPKAVSPP